MLWRSGPAHLNDELGDGDVEWRAAPAFPCGSVRGFVRLLANTADLGAVEAGRPALRGPSRCRT
ncbi:hypothetical protein GCM10025734_74300 [Kitasatospora paranensis]